MKTYKILNNQVFKKGAYVLVPIRMKDRYNIMRWRNEQIFHLRQSELLTKEDQDQYFKTVVAQLFDQEQPAQILFSFLKKDKCVGYGGLVHINWLDKNAEVSFVMETSHQPEHFKEYWGAFLRILYKVAFYDLSLHKIFTYAFDVRPHLYEALESAGFSFEARLKNHCIINSRLKDVVYHSLLNPIQFLRMRPAQLKDAKLLFQWANDPTVRQNALNQKEILWKEHLKWFEKKLNSEHSNIYIYSLNDAPVGQVRLDKVRDRWEIDYSVQNSYRGMGLGKLMLKKVLELKQYRPLHAIVKPENISSSKTFEQLNFDLQAKKNELLVYSFS